MQDDDLEAILNTALNRNKQHNVTGMLLYVQGKFINESGGRFMQVLEGSRADVMYLFYKIKQDPRHHSVNVVDQCNISKRNFDQWTMGFRKMSVNSYKRLPGYINLTSGFVAKSTSKGINIPLTFLKTFYSMNVVELLKENDN